MTISGGDIERWLEEQVCGQIMYSHCDYDLFGIGTIATL